MYLHLCSFIVHLFSSSHSLDFSNNKTIQIVIIADNSFQNRFFTYKYESNKGRFFDHKALEYTH